MLLFLSSIIDDKDDLTIPLVVQACMLGTDKHDPDPNVEFSLVSASALRELIDPDTDPVRKYRWNYPLPSSTLARVVKGAGGSLASLFDKLAWYLTWLNDEETINCCCLVEALCYLARPVPIHFHSFLHSKSLWRSLFTVLRKAVVDDGFPGFTGIEPSNNRLASRIFGIMLVGLRYGEDESLEEFESFVTLLAQGGLFQLLEDMLLALEELIDATAAIRVFPSESHTHTMSVPAEGRWIECMP